MQHILICSPSATSAGLHGPLAASGFRVTDRIFPGVTVKALGEGSGIDCALFDVEEAHPEIIAAIRVVSLALHVPVAVLANRATGEQIGAAFAAGATGFLSTAEKSAVAASLLTASIEQFRHQEGLRDELNKGRLALADRKLLDRAKSIIIEQLGCTEEAAYQRIRKFAMDRNIRLGQAADQIIAAMLALK